MKRVCWVGMLLVLGCQSSKTDDESGKPPERPTPAPEAGDPAPDLVGIASPWSPRTDAAQFFSRPAETWDENALELTDYSLAVAAKAGVATVTLTASVTNPTEGQAEAVIELPVPPGATVTSATLWLGDQPKEGVMLGSAKARQVYDEIVSRRRDPLLVAWGASDMLNVSIFPLEAKQTRRFQVRWVEPALTDLQWVPSFYDEGKLIGYPKQIEINGAVAQRDGDWVTIPRTAPAAAGPFRMKAQGATRPSAVAVVIDTSGNSSLDRDLLWKQVDELITALDGKMEVSVLAADWVLRELGSGRSAGELGAARDQFLAIRAAGWFDQRQAIVRAEELAGPSGAVAVVSSQLPAATVDATLAAPVYWVAGGGWTYERDLVDRSGGRWVADGAAFAGAARPLVSPQEAGFEWLPLDTATGHVVWLGYQKEAKVDSEAPASPLEALFYRAMLRRAEIPINKIVSPQTSIMVLESEEAYRQWGVKDEGGKLVRDRAASQATIAELLERGDEAPRRLGHGEGTGFGGGGTGWGTIGLGRYGTIGHGSGSGTGYGVGYGGLRGRHSSPPRVRIGQPMVYGELDKMIIRRYIRRVLPRIRYCYEQELLRHEELAGTATAEFTISVQGKVIAAKVTMDDPDGARTAKCIEKVIESIQFPKPKGGGLIKVTYPFQLTPGPATLWARARKLLDSGAPGVEKKIGALFGYDGAPDRDELAWWLADNHMRRFDVPPTAFLTVADLLGGGSSPTEDARRILSEAAGRYPEIAIETFRKWGATADAERVEKLWPPSQAYSGGIGSSGTGSGF